MSNLDEDYAAGVLDNCDPPCLSLYQPTHRHHPDNQQDPILFGNLVKELEESLLKQLPKEEDRPLLEPFLALADNCDFWNHTLDGLAVLGSKGIFRVYKLHRPVAKLAVVADSFHTKPLVRILQSADRFIKTPSGLQIFLRSSLQQKAGRILVMEHGQGQRAT